MESPPDPTSEPGKSASEAASAVRESPLNLDALRKAEHQAPVRRHSCSSTNRAVSIARVSVHALPGSESRAVQLAPWLLSATPV
ncbi:nuclear receptor ROR-alpha A isoform X1 [Tachysurus ichikawai]